MQSILNLTDYNFDNIIQNNNLVLVDFYAPWCGHCRTQTTIIQKLVQELDNNAIIATINIDENKQKAMQYSISGIPAILIFKNGKLVEQKAGVHKIEELKNLIQKHA